MEQENINTITIDTTNLENYRVGLEDKLYGIDNTIKTQLLEQLDRILDNLKDYNGKEITKKEGLNIDFRLCDLNKYINGLNEDKKLTNSLVFGVIKSVIEDFRKEYYNIIGIDINEEKDVSKNEIRYFDLMNLGNTTQEQQEVYFKEDEKPSKSKTSSSSLSFTLSDDEEKPSKSKTSSSSLSFILSDDEEKPSKSNNGSSEDYSSAIEEMGEVIVTQTNSRSSSPVSGL